MKYIRTKDRIINEKYVDMISADGKWIKIYNSKLDKYVQYDEFKEAENLYELCDLFIDEETKTIFHKHNGYVINWKTNMVYSLKALSESYHSVKGAIYTDKGLIYVAKMNDEGELCLL